MVDVYDHAYAEAHCGLIGLNVEIVQALVCFKGHIEYDLNVLKVRTNLFVYEGFSVYNETVLEAVFNNIIYI